MKTPWTDSVSRECPLAEYPRPQMVREGWLCLNGKWDYAITESACQPDKFDGQIVVPFSPETELSEVNRSLKPGEYLWYSRSIELPEGFIGKRLLLHFGAADNEAEVFVNGRSLVKHVGGYLPFTAEIGAAAEERFLDIVVRVQDDSDTGYHSRGKQTTKRGGIWYTPQSGIWQTVWMEAVPDCYIKSLKILPDFDNSSVSIAASVSGNAETFAIFEGKEYKLPALIPVPNFEAWSPENPKLYPFSVVCGEDRVESYFAMRKFSVDTDETGIKRFFLNNRPYFHNGLLDQGYWSDGMYTAPTDEALVFDIQTAKDMGFNVLRKHIKVEPLRWYYHCDRLGMIVWQDMMNGGGIYSKLLITAPLFTNIHLKDNKYRLFARADEAGRSEYYSELKEMIEHLYNCPCIGLWVPFNEGWGQFDAVKAYDFVKALDTSRIIDHASGWHDQGAGDARSWHVYFRPYHFRRDRKKRAVILSEFGGYSLPIEGHCFSSKLFGYRLYKNAEDFAKALEKLYSREIKPAIQKGLAASIYTELTDVEDELNGFITYDRQIVKLLPEQVKKIVCIEE